MELLVQVQRRLRRREVHKCVPQVAPIPAGAHADGENMHSDSPMKACHLFPSTEQGSTGFGTQRDQRTESLGRGEQLISRP